MIVLKLRRTNNHWLLNSNSGMLTIIEHVLFLRDITEPISTFFLSIRYKIILHESLIKCFL